VRYLELPLPHDAPLTAPDEIAAVLLEP